MTHRADTWAPQNDREARQHHDEMEDRVPQLPVPQDDPDWWLMWAGNVMRQVEAKTLSAPEAVCKLYRYVQAVAKIAKDRGPTEAENQTGDLT
jgi:hypothetical protein